MPIDDPALRRHARLPLTLLALLAVICVLTLWAPPAGRTSWALEVGPGLIEVSILLLSYRRLGALFSWLVASRLHDRSMASVPTARVA